MKNRRLFSLLMAIVVICCFAFFALGSGESTETDQGSGKAETVSEDSNLGDYKVVIDSCRLAKDYEGKDIVIVKYLFTNNAEKAASFMVAFDETVYQDGIGLNETFVADESANYSADNQTKEIKKGATLDVEVAYELNDLTTDIDVEVQELFSLDDSIVKKTFSIAQ